MNKKKRKEMQKALIEAAERRRRESLWSPDLPPEELEHFAIEAAERRRRESLWSPDLPPEELEHFSKVTSQYFECYQSISKKCSLPRRPIHNESPGKSHFGGSFLFPDRKPLPKSKDGTLLTPVFEFYVDELPFVPSQLDGTLLIQLFLELNQFNPNHYDNYSQLEYSGGDWEIITYDSIENLTERVSNNGFDPDFLIWDEVVTYPCYPDDLGIVPDNLEKLFEELPRSNEMAGEKITTGYWTRIGGWPTWLTGSNVGDFLIQIDGDSSGINLGFDGQLYLGLDKGKWEMAWEIG
ncbi:hypothetical protein SCOR_32970 [Sulfidibacter corallicola]|uniref:DUF1963 domain-containing protein n=1 Tax=Sulfidibacter corallicola TaxID=2818388 RepID=A0A8A4TI93_SULCO|nr:hypothetical protein [Sulfidibacter corallicola]QTD49646.1 hypothetical protein J3U87_29030 [Sulfidibacter corallicola]